MYKKITALLCLTLSIVLFGFTASATDAINTVYVSGTAAEGGTGVISAPVSSLAEAYSLIGSMRNGTIYLMDTVSVSATSGDCFIAPTHIGKITISSADGYDGALDLSGVEHYHFGGETEFSSLELIANDLVLSADNHALILGEGITVSSLRGNSEYRNGHTFCGANINVTVYCPCENATAEITTADGSLYIFSGEYRSVSSWFGSSLTVDSGKINIFLGGVGDTDTLWVRYLCPGLFGSKVLSPLTCNENTYVYVDVMLDSGANIAEFYSSTQNLLVGRICVNWKLFNNVCTDTVAIASSMLTPLSGSSCRITASVSREDAVLIAKAQRISGKNDVSVISECSASNHDYYTRPDGRIVCMKCGYEKCRHLTTVTVETAPATCTDGIEYTTYCTDLCGDSVGKSYGPDVDPNNHSGYIPKYNYSEKYAIMAFRCSGCNYRYAVLNESTVSNRIIVGEGGTDYMPECPPPQDGSDLHFATFENAMKYAAVALNFVEAEYTIEIRGAVSVPNGFTMPAFDGHITITGNENAALYFDCHTKRIRLSGDLTIEKIKFISAVGTGGGIVVCAQNHKLVMGEGITVQDREATMEVPYGTINIFDTDLFVIGGFPGSNAYGQTIDSDITVRSGSYRFIGGWNYNASTNDGKAKLTIGRTNPDDMLYVEYLCPFSRGDGYITSEAESTIIIDGDVTVEFFYVTTLNKATDGIDYVVNIVLKGDVNGNNGIDIRGTADNDFYPQAVINLFVDERIDTAVVDSYPFLGHPDGNYARDITLDTIGADVHEYTVQDYCTLVLGGHVLTGVDGLCVECGY